MTVLFLMSPAHGHLNRSFLLARQLQADDYTIVYGHFGNHELAHQIKQQGFSLHWMQTIPFGVGLDELIHQNKQEPYLETLLDRLTKRTFHTRTAELASTMTLLKPSLVVLDVFMSTDFIILYPLLKAGKASIILLQTMLSAYDDGLTPPLNSTFVPGNDSEHAIRNAWRRQYVQRWFNDLRERLLYLGQSQLRLIRWAFRRNSLPDEHRIRTDKIFHVGFHNVPEWITAPCTFDFPERQLLSFQHYLNAPLVNLERVEDIPPAYQTVVDCIKQEQQINQAIKLIYVSLGTAQQATKKGAEERFFNRLIDATRIQPDWRVILAVRPELVDSIKPGLPNVFVFAHVPQLSLLQRADLFITHGGLNSVLEAISHHVPMLVYPFNKQWDLPGNAARVVAHGVGLMGDFLRDEAPTMARHIERLLTDTSYKNNLFTLRKHLLPSRKDEEQKYFSIFSPLNF